MTRGRLRERLEVLGEDVMEHMREYVLSEKVRAMSDTDVLSRVMYLREFQSGDTGKDCPLCHRIAVALGVEDEY